MRAATSGSPAEIVTTGRKTTSREVPTAIRSRDENALGGVGVRLDDDAVRDRDVEVTQQVALSKGRDQHLLGIPPVDVAVEHPSSRTRDDRFARDPQLVVAAVGTVAARALAAVARPLEGGHEAVIGIHRHPPLPPLSSRLAAWLPRSTPR